MSVKAFIFLFSSKIKKYIYSLRNDKSRKIALFVYSDVLKNSIQKEKPKKTILNR